MPPNAVQVFPMSSPSSKMLVKRHNVNGGVANGVGPDHSEKDAHPVSFDEVSMYSTTGTSEMRPTACIWGVTLCTPKQDEAAPVS